MRKFFSPILPAPLFAVLLSAFLFSGCSSASAFWLSFAETLFPTFELQPVAAFSDIRVIRYPGKRPKNAKGIVLEEMENATVNSAENSLTPQADKQNDSSKRNKMNEKKTLFPSKARANKKKSSKNSTVNSTEKIKIIPGRAGRKSLRLKERTLKEKDENIVIHEVAPPPLRPDFIKGIYLSNYTVQVPEYMEKHIADAQKYGINTFVIDVQRKSVDVKLIQKLIDKHIYPVARVVVFEGGLAEKTPSQEHIQGILNYIEVAAKLGFKEVQLDYIRYADYQSLRKLSLEFKYGEIDKILTKAQAVAKKNDILISADLFGRVTLNNNDHIGQKLEIFGKRMDVLYPMLYPSHYYFDDFRTSHPYETVKEGVANSVARVGQEAKIVAYIQGFHMYVDKSGLSFEEYVRRQMQGVEDARGDGWIIWNPRNQYQSCYLAMLAEKKRKEKELMQAMR